MAESGDERPTLEPEGTEHLRGLMRRMHSREPIQIDPEEYQMLLRMQDKLEWQDRQLKKFLERHDIEAVARAVTVEILGTLNIDASSPKAVADTSNKIGWLMGIKPGVKGAIYAILGVILTGAGTLIVTWLQTVKGGK